LSETRIKLTSAVLSLLAIIIVGTVGLSYFEGMSPVWRSTALPSSYSLPHVGKGAQQHRALESSPLILGLSPKDRGVGRSGEHSRTAAYNSLARLL
jgi:hypothetical protein